MQTIIAYRYHISKYKAAKVIFLAYEFLVKVYITFSTVHVSKEVW